MMDYTYLYFMLIFAGCTFLGIIISLFMPGAWESSHCNDSGNKIADISEEIMCPTCSGTGRSNEKHVKYIRAKCSNCSGTGEVTVYQEEDYYEYEDVDVENEWGQVIYKLPRQKEIHIHRQIPIKNERCSVCGGTGEGEVVDKAEDYTCLSCSGKGKITKLSISGGLIPRPSGA
jgi:DnaJ-class molecular chaperone